MMYTDFPIMHSVQKSHNFTFYEQDTNRNSTALQVHPESMAIDEDTIEVMDEFIYLGTKIYKD